MSGLPTLLSQKFKSPYPRYGTPPWHASYMKKENRILFWQNDIWYKKDVFSTNLRVLFMVLTYGQ